MQQINLYDVLPKPEKVILPAIQLLAICGGFFVLLLLFSMFDLWKAYNIDTTLQKLTQEQVTATQTLIDLKKKYPTILADIELKQKIEATQKLLAEKQQVLEKVHQLAKAKGFSNYFSSIAETIPDGVWLTKIFIDNDNNQVLLQGKSINTSLLTKFLTALAKTDSFAKVEFNIFNINKPKEKNGTMDFKLATQEQADEQN